MDNYLVSIANIRDLPAVSPMAGSFTTRDHAVQAVGMYAFDQLSKLDEALLDQTYEPNLAQTYIRTYFSAECCPEKFTILRMPMDKPLRHALSYEIVQGCDTF